MSLLVREVLTPWLWVQGALPFLLLEMATAEGLVVLHHHAPVVEVNLAAVAQVAQGEVFLVPVAAMVVQLNLMETVIAVLVVLAVTLEQVVLEAMITVTVPQVQVVLVVAAVAVIEILALVQLFTTHHLAGVELDCLDKAQMVLRV
jgi:hypothetical protein